MILASYVRHGDNIDIVIIWCDINSIQLLTDDKALFEWITTLEETGIHLVVDAPTRNGQLLKLAQKVAFLRKTNYG